MYGHEGALATKKQWRWRRRRNSGRWKEEEEGRGKKRGRRRERWGGGDTITISAGATGTTQCGFLVSHLRTSFVFMCWRYFLDCLLREKKERNQKQKIMKGRDKQKKTRELNSFRTGRIQSGQFFALMIQIAINFNRNCGELKLCCDGFSFLKAILEISWGFLRILEDSWGFLRIFQASFFGILKKILEISVGFLRILRILEDSWGFLRILEDSWGFLGSLWDSRRRFLRFLWDSWEFYWIFEDSIGFLRILLDSWDHFGILEGDSSDFFDISLNSSRFLGIFRNFLTILLDSSRFFGILQDSSNWIIQSFSIWINLKLSKMLWDFLRVFLEERLHGNKPKTPLDPAKPSPQTELHEPSNI